jgi:hypothetical protein
MAILDKEEYVPVWLPSWLPEDVLEEIYLGILAAAERPPKDLPEESDPACGYIIRGWFGPFLLSPPTRFARGRC